MKWAYPLKHKLKAVMALLVIMATILIGNIYERHNFKTLDKRISSIYEDRLMPATYIYELSGHLYQKRLLHDAYGDNNTSLRQDAEAHDEAIAALVANYEKTFLTAEEKDHWEGFKTSLYNYNRQYDIALNNTGEAAENSEQLGLYFTQLMAELDALNKIQAGVGAHLEKDSHAIISSTVIPSYLENSLLVVLGIICMILFSVSDKQVFRNVQHSQLN